MNLPELLDLQLVINYSAKGDGAVCSPEQHTRWHQHFKQNLQKHLISQFQLDMAQHPL